MSSKPTWDTVTSTNPIPLSTKSKNQQFQEVYLVTLAPGINIHDLDNCQIELNSILKGDKSIEKKQGLKLHSKPKEKLIEKEIAADFESYKYEDPMTDTNLSDKDRVKTLKDTPSGCSKLNYTVNVYDEKQQKSNMVMIKAVDDEPDLNSFKETSKIMMPVDGEILITQDLLGEIGELTVSEYNTEDRILSDHKPPVFNEQDRKKRWVNLGNWS